MHHGHSYCHEYRRVYDNSVLSSRLEFIDGRYNLDTSRIKIRTTSRTTSHFVDAFNHTVIQVFQVCITVPC